MQNDQIQMFLGVDLINCDINGNGVADSQPVCPGEGMLLAGECKCIYEGRTRLTHDKQTFH